MENIFKSVRTPAAVLLLVCMLLSFPYSSAAAEMSVPIPVSQKNTAATDYAFEYQLSGSDAASSAAIKGIASENGIYEFTIKSSKTDVKTITLPEMAGDGSGEINFSASGVYSFDLQQNPDQEYPTTERKTSVGTETTTVSGSKDVYHLQIAVVYNGTSGGKDVFRVKQVVVTKNQSSEKLSEILFENPVKVVEVPDPCTLTYVSNGGTEFDPEVYDKGEDAGDEIRKKIPEREGFEFIGWFADEALTDPIENDEKFIMNQDRIVYAGWEKSKLNKEDHFAYIIGYPDGTVQPEGNITRAEVATIFFRLLKDETRADMWSNKNDFYDVGKYDWFNNAVSTLYNGHIVEGDQGRFRPNHSITRAEFAVIAARFDPSDPDTSSSKLNDIKGHWSEPEIRKAEALGYITGYEDNSFKPDQKITRAEAMTLINRVLGRDTITPEGLLHDQMVKWSDNMDKNKWYYAAVQEATNSHHYDMPPEVWTEMRENRDWAALEKVNSKPDSSSNPGDVMTITSVLNAAKSLFSGILDALK